MYSTLSQSSKQAFLLVTDLPGMVRIFEYDLQYSESCVAICLEIAFPSKALLTALFDLHWVGQSEFQQMYSKRPPSTLASVKLLRPIEFKKMQEKEPPSAITLTAQLECTRRELSLVWSHLWPEDQNLSLSYVYTNSPLAEKGLNMQEQKINKVYCLGA